MLWQGVLKWIPCDKQSSFTARVRDTSQKELTVHANYEETDSSCTIITKWILSLLKLSLYMYFSVKDTDTYILKQTKMVQHKVVLTKICKRIQLDAKSHQIKGEIITCQWKVLIKFKNKVNSSTQSSVNSKCKSITIWKKTFPKAVKKTETYKVYKVWLKYHTLSRKGRNINNYNVPVKSYCWQQLTVYINKT